MWRGLIQFGVRVILPVPAVTIAATAQEAWCIVASQQGCGCPTSIEHQ